MLAMLAFCACSSNSDEAGDEQHLWNVTLTASMGDAATRALSEGADNAIIANFAENDEVVVVDADGSTIVGTLKAQTAGASTTLTGTLNALSLAVDEVVTLRYHSATANYDGQVGTLAGISASQDYAEGTLTVKTIEPLEFTTTGVTLAAKQSITKFSFIDVSTSADVSVKTFGVAAVGLVQSIATNGTETVGAVTGTLVTASPDAYIALRNNVAGKQRYYFTVKDEAGNWYTGTKSAPLENGRNYATSVKLTKLATLTSSSDVGTIGVVDGLPAIVVEINSTKKAVALMNAGALCPEHYGTYYIFANLASGLTDGWYVPSKDELDALAAITNAWGAPNGVNGRTFTVSEGKTFFMPAAGLDDGDNDPHDFLYVSTYGYYWSATNYNEDLAYCLSFGSTSNTTLSDYKIDGLTVRPFHALQ